MKVTPARQFYVRNFYTEFHENLSVTTSQRKGDGWTWYPHKAFFILIRTEGLTNHAPRGPDRNLKDHAPINEKIICKP
jgi:hypothetical protein